MRIFRVLFGGLSLLWFVALAPEAARTLQAGPPAQTPAPAQRPAAAQTPAPAQPPAAAPASSAPAEQANESQSTPAGELVRQYCVACHNQKLAVNGVNANLHLDQADSKDVANSAEVWEKVILKLRMRAMPPPQVRRRPDNETYDKVAAWIESGLDKAAQAHPDAGRPGLHRLNRVEYAYTVRDLLGIEIDPGQWLPPDDHAYGFDNNADALNMTPALLDRYMSGAAQLARMAVGDPTIRPTFDRYTAVKNNSNDRTFLWQNDRLDEEFPLGSRGGIAVRHYFPVDGEYIIRIRPDVTYQGEIRGLNYKNQLEIRIDGERVGQFTIGGDGAGGRGRSLNVDDLRVESLGLESRVPVRAGMREVTATLLKGDDTVAEGLGPNYMPIWTHTYDGDASAPMLISALYIGGPYNGQVPKDSESRHRVFICHPANAGQETGCATKILTTLARRAYRRPVTAEDAQTLMGFYKEGRAQGDFDAGVRTALERILASPDFLYRIERDPAKIAPGSNFRISDVELASRMSYFLWSTMPDEELLGLAEKGQLKDPAVLEKQVRRMLADPRAQESLLDNFFDQWLQTRNVWQITPDISKHFPWFDDNLRTAYVKEMQLWLGSQLAEDRSIMDLLTSDYTYLNERLAKFYGVSGVYGSHFRRVTLGDENRFGLLGKAAVISVASTYPDRTSPTLRGKWLLENLLDAPMPPPPANVNTNLIESAGGGKPKTIREMLETHRANPACASCHGRMDPLGLGLENFDAIGQWRTTDNGFPINATGVLLDGSKFEGAAQLRAALAAKPDNFLRAVTDKLMIYALGRNIEFYDRPAVRKIVRDAQVDDYRWSSVIMGVIKSVPFQMRRAKS